MIYENITERLDKIYDEEIKNQKDKYEIYINILSYISNKTIENKVDQITKINIVVLGKTNVGKTTLINNILFLPEEKRGQEGGKGVSTTMNDTVFYSDILNHISITDTQGIDNDNFSLPFWLERYKKKMDNGIREGNYGDLIHVIWYCVNGDPINNSEIEKIKNITKIFNGYNVPIIFAYLKPFEGNINVTRNRTELINKNFIKVNSKKSIKLCDRDIEENCQDKVYRQCGMKELLLNTTRMSHEGITNTMASQISSDFIEEIKKRNEKNINQKLLNLKILVDEIIKKLEKQENSKEIEKAINKTRKDAIQIIISLIEEILYGKNSIKHLSKNSIILIKNIQQDLETMYSEIYQALYNELIKNAKIGIENDMKEFHCQANKNLSNSFFKILSDLDEAQLKNDLQLVEDLFNSACLVEIYSIQKSLEKFYFILEKNIVRIIESYLNKIISDKKLKKELDNKIKINSSDKIKKIIKELEIEINSAFDENKKKSLN